MLVVGFVTAKELNEPKPEGTINEAQRQAAFADVLILNKARQLFNIFMTCSVIW